MGGHIDCYLDLSSIYSFFTLTYLLKNRELLTSHDVTVDFVPIFLGGVNHGSGNKPPWTLPAKAKYGKFDSDRAKKYHGLENISVPDFFPPVTLLPQRALCYIKTKFSSEVFEKTWLALFHSMWIEHNNITLAETFTESLKSTGYFSQTEVESITKSTAEKEWKDTLLENTKKILDQGAFGAPWMWVRNSAGKEEPFFGSDRFHFMWEYLGVPWHDIEILPKAKAKL